MMNVTVTVTAKEKEIPDFHILETLIWTFTRLLALACTLQLRHRIGIVPHRIIHRVAGMLPLRLLREIGIDEDRILLLRHPAHYCLLPRHLQLYMMKETENGIGSERGKEIEKGTETCAELALLLLPLLDATMSMMNETGNVKEKGIGKGIADTQKTILITGLPLL